MCDTPGCSLCSSSRSWSWYFLETTTRMPQNKQFASVVSSSLWRKYGSNSLLTSSGQSPLTNLRTQLNTASCHVVVAICSAVTGSAWICPMVKYCLLMQNIWCQGVNMIDHQHSHELWLAWTQWNNYKLKAEKPIIAFEQQPMVGLPSLDLRWKALGDGL